MIKSFEGVSPRIDSSVFIAENAAVIGEVTIGAESSVWYNTVLRGDVNNIIIGARTNIQDGTVVHVSSITQGAYVGDDVTVGHMALVHACTIGNRVLIGMQACVMDDAQIGDDVILAAGSLVTPRKIIPSGQLWAGRPAKYVRDLTDEDRKELLFSAARYVELAKKYR